MTILCALSALLWISLLVVPWRPWSTREQLVVDSQPNDRDRDLGAITALIPARDEATVIADTLRALDAQGQLGGIILVDDQSSDGTAAAARTSGARKLEVIDGTAPPGGWSGKLWALEQARLRATTPLVLLLDADIELAPGTLAALLKQLQADHRTLVSVMATLHMQGFWEKLLLPPFIYFFKLIYPFALANQPTSRMAAAAGGVMLVRRAALDEIGGFGALHDAIIDDCTLARRLKESGGRTWVGLSRAARAIRPYGDLPSIWNMVARTAYTQLHYSPALLALCTALMAVCFIAPLAGLASGGWTSAWSIVALAAMLGSYAPTVRFYDLPARWIVTLPAAGILFLAMTWTSALRYSRGERSRWKNRSYERDAAT